ncbi:hypothetical protein [Enterococcus faecium]|uniref:hypothetical protein n=1 Tax=Enterococcus faecium TaxID=1352 RepID=UPI000812DBD1|nr:hypothetical protein [Enterococcus faecium]
MADRKLEKLLEETWNPKEFSEFFMENFETDLAVIVKDALREQGYPETANYININFTLYTENKGTWDFWATLANKELSDKSDTGIRNFFESNRDDYMYANNQNKLNFRVEFDETPEEFIERQPPKENVAKVLENRWNSDEIVSTISELGGQYEPLVEAVREELRLNKFPDVQNIDVSQIEINVKITNKLDYGSWADIALEKYIYSTLKEFIENRMDIMYLQHPQYLNFGVEIATPLEEWKMEQGID